MSGSEPPRAGDAVPARLTRNVRRRAGLTGGRRPEDLWPGPGRNGDRHTGEFALPSRLGAFRPVRPQTTVNWCEPAVTSPRWGSWYCMALGSPGFAPAGAVALPGAAIRRPLRGLISPSAGLGDSSATRPVPPGLGGLGSARGSLNRKHCSQSSGTRSAAG
jgi:hypothetical protein